MRNITWLALAWFWIVYVGSASAELPNDHQQERALQQRLDGLREAAEALRRADQEDMAVELSKRAEVLARELLVLQQMQEQAETPQTESTNRAEEESKWRAEVMSLLKDLRQQVTHLKKQVSELQGQLTEQRLREEEARFAKVDLSGQWLMILPAGFKYETVITKQAGDLYRLKVTGNLAGLYRHHGKRLKVEVPTDERLTEFVWEFQDENLLLLTESPPVAKIGSDYRGATLSRSIASTDAPSDGEPSVEKPPQRKPPSARKR